MYMFPLEKGQHRFTEVQVLDEQGAGNAYNEYQVVHIESSHKVFATVKFQNGPVKEVGVNGIFMEDLLNICCHRLECFQSGDFACQYNADALKAIEDALACLNARTKDRQAHGVEGRSLKCPNG
jgi:hypothetical protein